MHLELYRAVGQNGRMKKKPGRKAKILDANQMAAAILQLASGEPLPGEEIAAGTTPKKTRPPSSWAGWAARRAARLGPLP